MFIFEQDPNETQAYGCTYTNTLSAGDNITASTWAIVPSGMDAPINPTFDDTSTAVRLRGGVHGEEYEVTNTVDTLLGAHLEETFLIKIRSKQSA